MHASPHNAEFSLKFGPVQAGAPSSGKLAVPVLAGADDETLFKGLAAAGSSGGFELFAAGDWLVGRLLAPVQPDIAAQTESVYISLLAINRALGRSLVRIWNYVPGINDTAAEGIETYRAFCRGRSHAFEHAGWAGPVPAASAVGGAPGMLAVLFAATRAAPVAQENPEQMPAYEYPPDYGPRSPSFSRAMQVTADGRRWTFISGTAAIKGHVSMSTGDLPGQIACTLDNLRLISSACDLGEKLGAGTNAERHFKIYLRHATDLEPARQLLEGGLLQADDQVTWLQADICRSDLLIEIEATVIG